MSKTLLVIAVAGLKVPMEENGRKYIETAAVEVPDNTYYRRLIIAGDLVEKVTEVVEPTNDLAETSSDLVEPTKPKAKKEPKDGQ